MSDVSNLGELLERRAAEEPDRVGYVFLSDSDSGDEPLTYGELQGRAGDVAASLAGTAAPGDRVLLLFPTGLDFVAAFFGCIRAGVVGVPVASPLAGRLDRSLPALEAIARDCEPVAVLTTGAVLEEAEGSALPEALAAARRIAVDRIPGGGAAPEAQPATPDDLAYLQYTSGSTASPRGAMILHGNVLANLEAIRGVTRQSRDGCSLMWLPHYHDMGLAGMLGLVGQRNSHPSIHDRPLEGSLFPDEDVDLEPCHRIDNVEGPPLTNGLVDRRGAEVVVRTEARQQLGFLTREGVDRNVGIPRQTRIPMNGTGE